MGRPRQWRHKLQACFWSGGIILLCLPSSPVRGDLAKQHLSHDRLILPGGRAALLGGAYTALSSDPAGLLYNPAGTVFSRQHEISLNTWSQFRSETLYKGAVRGQDFEENSLNRFGGFTGGLFKRQAFTLGYVITTLDKRDINQDDYFTDLSREEGEVRDYIRIHQESNSYDLFGGSLAVALGKSWGLGVVLFFYDRSIEAMNYQQVAYGGGRVLVQEAKFQVSNQGFLGSAGLSYRGDEWSLGLSVRQGQALFNKGRANINTVGFSSSGTIGPRIEQISSDEYRDDDEQMPQLTRFGLAWHSSPYWLLSFDVQHSAFLKSSNTTPDRQETLNLALGLELGPESFKILSGVFTNSSLFPELTATEDSQFVKLDYLGRSAGFAFLRRSFDLFLGYVQQTGRGSSQIIAGSSDVQDVEAILENYVVSWNFKLQ